MGWLKNISVRSMPTGTLQELLHEEFSEKLLCSRAVDPHSLYADPYPDPAVFLNADPDPQPWLFST